MNRLVHSAVAIALAASAATASARLPARGSECKPVHADLVESRGTACRPGDTNCFLGSVDGNHGLRGTTYFSGKSSTAPIPTSPEFRGYSGIFEYATERGTLTAHESGVTSPTVGVVTAYQQITAGTGEFEGVAGHFFVSGSNDGQNVVTKVTGEICYP